MTQTIQPKAAEKNKELVFIVASGQIATADQSKTVDAFAKLMQEQSKFPYLCNLRVNLALFLDTIWYGTIKKYKAGEIDDATFRERISNQLGIKVDSDKFDAAWNAMCTISQEAFKTLKEIQTLQEANKFVIEVIAASNNIQMKYVVAQLKEKLGWELPITSVSEEKKPFKDLLNQVAKKYDDEAHKIVSLVDIKPEVTKAELVHAPCREQWADKIKAEFNAPSASQRQ